jgi:hypothetical protein
MIMKTSITAVLIASALFAGPALHARIQDPLWDRALDYVRKSPCLLPTEVEQREQVLDAKGALQCESVTVFSVKTEQGSFDVHLERRVEDGVDQTERHRASLEQELCAVLEGFGNELPFPLKDPSKVIEGRLPVEQEFNGLRCAGFRFEVSDGDLDAPCSESFRLMGTVWVALESGVPVRIESRVMDLPRRDGDAELTSCHRVVDFVDVQGKWIKTHEVQEVWINSSVMFKRSVLVVISRNGYRGHSLNGSGITGEGDL